MLLLLTVAAFYLTLPRTIERPPTVSPVPNEKRPFSELTLFLFGGGVALFVALVGWSDQIRGIDKDTRELEKTFLADTGVSKKDFLSVVRAPTPDDELTALTTVMTGGVLQSVDYIKLLGIFKTWNKDWKHLENVAGLKYTLTMGLTISFFLSGLVSLFTNPVQQVVVVGYVVRDEVFLLLCPVVLMAIILAIIIYANAKEKALRALLRKITDMV